MNEGMNNPLSFSKGLIMSNEIYLEEFFKCYDRWHNEASYYFLGKHIYNVYNIFFLSKIELSDNLRSFHYKINGYMHDIVDGIKITNPNIIIHYYKNKGNITLGIFLFNDNGNLILKYESDILDIEKFIQLLINSLDKNKYLCKDFDEFCREFVKFHISFLIKNSEKLYLSSLYKEVLGDLVYEN